MPLSSNQKYFAGSTFFNKFKIENFYVNFYGFGNSMAHTHTVRNFFRHSQCNRFTSISISTTSTNNRKSAVESVRNHDSSKQNYLSMLNSFLSRPSGKNEQLGKRLSKTLSQSPSLRIRGRTVNNSAKRNFVNALQCNNKPLPSFLLSIRPFILPSIGSTTKQQKIMTTSSTHPWCYGTMAADDGIQHKSNVPTNQPTIHASP